MTVITIRNVPEELNERLKDRARERGQSLQQFLLRELAEAADRSPLEARLREAIAHLTPLSLSADDIRATLEAARDERDARANAIIDNAAGRG